jgi:hypothetical protein
MIPTNGFYVHPNKGIENGGQFLSNLDLEFSGQFNSELNFKHPNTAYEITHVCRCKFLIISTCLEHISKLRVITEILHLNTSNKPRFYKPKRMRGTSF